VTARATRAETRTPFAAPQLDISEAAFQQRVMDLAMYCGWRIVHIPAVPEKRGRRVYHRTPYVGHGGLLDLIMARGGVVELAEVKREGEKPTPDQKLWLASAGPHGHLWYPHDWDEIRATLRRAA
jgi:hypothetical protein